MAKVKSTGGVDKRGVAAMTNAVTKGMMRLQAPGKGAKTNVVPAKKSK